MKFPGIFGFITQAYYSLHAVNLIHETTLYHFHNQFLQSISYTRQHCTTFIINFSSQSLTQGNIFSFPYWISPVSLLHKTTSYHFHNRFLQSISYTRQHFTTFIIDFSCQSPTQDNILPHFIMDFSSQSLT